jgi:general secretion pathway protein N
MKKRGLLYVIFGLVFYLIFIIIETPASWLAWGLSYYTHNTVHLDPLSGSLWHGNGRLVINYPPSVPHDFGQTEWSINPLWLLTGRVQLSLETDATDRKIKTTLGISKESFILNDTDAAFPAIFVSQLYPPAALIGPQGQVRLRTSNLVFGRQILEGNATLEWQGAGSSLSNVSPLGDYRLEIVGVGKTADLKLSTARGALELTGQGQWQLQNGQLHLNGSATPRERLTELEPLLKLFGGDQGNGKRQLVLSSHVPFMTP